MFIICTSQWTVFYYPIPQNVSPLKVSLLYFFSRYFVSSLYSYPHNWGHLVIFILYIQFIFSASYLNTDFHYYVQIIDHGSICFYRTSDLRPLKWWAILRTWNNLQNYTSKKTSAYYAFDERTQSSWPNYTLSTDGTISRIRHKKWSQYNKDIHIHNSYIFYWCWRSTSQQFSLNKL